MLASPPSASAKASSSTQRDKIQAQPRSQRKKVNPLQILALIALILLCASGVWRSLHQGPSTKMVQVVAAARDIPNGTKIGFMMLRYINIPANLCTKDMVVSLSSVVAHESRTYLAAGEPIKTGSLFASTDGLSANLASSERAITLQLKEDEMVDHAIAPDDLVDVISLCSKDGKKYAKTICQSARVLSTAPKAQLMARRMGAESNRITLAVTPDTAELLSEAVDNGKIRLVLRGRYNRTQEVLNGTGIKDLLPSAVLKEEADELAAMKLQSQQHSAPILPPPPPELVANSAADSTALQAPAAPGPLQWVVEMISGSKKEAVSVPEK